MRSVLHILTHDVPILFRDDLMLLFCFLWEVLIDVDLKTSESKRDLFITLILDKSEKLFEILPSLSMKSLFSEYITDENILYDFKVMLEVLACSFVTLLEYKFSS